MKLPKPSYSPVLNSNYIYNSALLNVVNFHYFFSAVALVIVIFNVFNLFVGKTKYLVQTISWSHNHKLARYFEEIH